jgi:glycosyltransferase involved in cell wall biosynthesis
MTRYAVVTPVRNDAENLRRVARCLAAQTALPAAWMIVDAGSDDETPDVIAALAAEHPWVATCTSDSILAGFNAGAAALETLPEFVVKLDADVSMGDDYVERLLGAFAEDPELGIASGACHERVDGEWRLLHVTGDHVWGVTRAYRHGCLADVSPLEERLGWDGIDEIKAALRGWRTRTVHDLPFYRHGRADERGASRASAWSAIGDASHYLGYRPGYLLLRALNNARRERAALAMITGYAGAALRRRERCPDEEVRSFIRSGQSLRRLPQRVREALGLAAT